MKKLFLFLAWISVSFASVAQQRGDLISHELLEVFCEDELRALYADFGLPEFFVPIQYSVEIHKISYWTEHPKTGGLTPASGLVTLPACGNCDFPMVCYNHGSFTYAENISSLSGSSLQHYFGGPFAANGYVAVIPDYLGYGDSDLHQHPYLHAASSASAAIDMVRAGRHFCRQMGVRLNEQLFLAGYSEGGFVTMAMHRVMERDFPDEFHITASAPSGGAYDQYGISRDSILYSDRYSHPFFLTFLVMAYDYIYENIYDKTFDVFLPPYDEWVLRIYDRLHPEVELLDSMPVLAIDMVQPWFRELLVSAPDFPLNAALMENETYDWAPLAPMHLYYCSSDERVPPLQSVFTAQHMNALGADQVEAIDVNASANHVDCGYFSMLGAKLWFDTYRLPCKDTLPPETVVFEFAPNPFTDYLTLTSNAFHPDQDISLRVFDLSGREFASEPVVRPGMIRLPFGSMHAGLYVFDLRSAENRWVFLLMKG